MLDLPKVAVTGGVASGKTTVCGLFRHLGAYVVNADQIAHQLLDPQTDLGKKVLQIIGNDVLQNGKINRRLVAEKVFQSKELLHQLETLIHPRVMEKIEEEYERISKKGGYPLFIAEMPLLFEIEAEPFFDSVIAIVADETLAQERFQALGATKLEYNRRMERQLSPTKKAQKANYTIFNNGSLDDLKKQVESLYTLLLNHGEP